MKQLHHLHARLLREPDATCIDRRDAAVAGQGDADGLAQAVHGVRREHARAGAAAGAGIVLDIPELFRVHAPRADRADGLKDAAEIHRVPVSIRKRQHRPAGNKHAGQVEPGRRHQHAGHHLVAVGDEHQRVKAVGHGHAFHRIRDQLAGGQGIAHALVAHRDAVADGDGVELKGRAASHQDAILDGAGYAVKFAVARHHLVEGIDHADEGPLDLRRVHAQGLQQGAVRRAADTALDLLTSHRRPPFARTSWRAAPRLSFRSGDPSPARARR